MASYQALQEQANKVFFPNILIQWIPIPSSSSVSHAQLDNLNTQVAKYEISQNYASSNHNREILQSCDYEYIYD